jgi:hypothetical protein
MLTYRTSQALSERVIVDKLFKHAPKTVLTYWKIMQIPEQLNAMWFHRDSSSLRSLFCFFAYWPNENSQQENEIVTMFWKQTILEALDGSFSATPYSVTVLNDQSFVVPLHLFSARSSAKSYRYKIPIAQRNCFDKNG